LLSLLCLPTGFVNGMGFEVLLLPPVVFSLSHCLLSDPSVARRVQLAHHCQLVVIFKGGPSLAHCRVSPPVVSMRWASLRSSSLPPSSPSPLTSLTYLPLHCHCVLPRSQSSAILVDCYFLNCRWSKGNDFVIVVVGLCCSCPPPPPSSPSPFTSLAHPSIACCVLPFLRAGRGSTMILSSPSFECLRPKRLHSRCMPRRALRCVPRCTNVGVIQRCTPMDAF
jgi:hypothetical protein